MATLSLVEVKRLARLAHLSLSQVEAKAFVDELNAILGYVKQLQAIKTEGLEPTAQVTGLTNVMRPDTEIDYGVHRQDLLANTPAQHKGYIKVPRILSEQ